jgi:hypothetical protein
MDFAPVKKWAFFFMGILCAIVIADTLSNALVSMTGMAGWMKFLVSFYPVCGFLLCNSLWSGKNIPYRIFWFLALMKKGCTGLFLNTEHSSSLYTAVSSPAKKTIPPKKIT